MIRYYTTQDPFDCCGCRACEAVCTKGAISFSNNEEGFAYPQIDKSICTDCGSCERACPMVKVKQLLFPMGKAYAFQTYNKQKLAKSSSGGAFFAIANMVLSEGGVVFGASWDGKYVKHKQVTEVEKLYSLMGSKYVQSDTANTYWEVKKYLQDGRSVYYTGTPCQIAGLRLFLRKDYDNLLTSDLVCHGTPSPKILAETITHIEERVKGKFVEYNFRDKKVGGWSCSSSSSYITESGQTIYLKHSKEMDAYFNAFISGHIMRKNCYKCPYAQINRTADITIADYWGVKQLHPEFSEINKGMSLIISNTPHGDSIIKILATSNFVKQVDIAAASNSNLNLIHPSPYSKEREYTYNMAFNDYSNFIDKYYVGNYYKRKIYTDIVYYIRSHEWIYNIVSKLCNIWK